MTVLSNWFADRRVRTKILIALLLTALVAAATGILALQRMATMDHRLSQVRADNVQNLILLGAIRGSQSAINHNAALRVANPTNPTIQAEADKGTAAAIDRLNKALAAYGKQPKTAAADQTLAEFTQLWGEFTTALAGVNSGKPPTIDFNVVVPGMETAAEKLSEIENTEAQRAVARAHDEYVAARREVLIALAVGLLVAIGLALLVAGSIVRRLLPVAQAMEAVATGDLTRTAPVTGKDEIGQMAQAANRASTGVRETVTALVSSAERLSRSSEQLTTVTDEVVASAGAVSERARAADSSAGQISQDLRTVASGAEQMAASIQEIAHSANEGARVASQAVEVVGTTNQTVSKLGDSSLKIGNVVKLITSIAEQTNLLALNATIEAARAGEAGKGFAVVAGEVKDLAQETAKATEDISRLVQAIQADTESAVSAITEISSIIEQINNYQTAIAAAVEEQTRTTGEMNRNVSNAATGAAQIAENVSQVSGAAESTTRSVAVGRQAAGDLAHLAGELQRLVARFTS